MYGQLILEHPILGVGLSGGNYISILNFGIVKSVHNVILEVALYSGLFGLIPFLIFLYSIIRNNLLSYKKSQNILPILLSIPMLGMILSGQALGVKLFWTIAAYSMSYKNYNNI